ncbi:MAG: DUF2892 domain-containing protein [Rubrivivax sp.]|jgi:hypothetical protein|nr:DUF2892 domain-containing protein [Rubrivivax sp.]
MTVDRIIHIVAGTFVLGSLLLDVPGSPLFMSSWWPAFTAFVWANLQQFGYTNFCPLGWILKKMGVSDTQACCPQ